MCIRDRVIVGAAFVFAFNWVGANSSAVDVLSTKSATVSGGLSLADSGVVRTKPMDNYAESVAVFSVTTQRPQPLSDNTGAGVPPGEMAAVGTPIIVVAIDRASGLVADSESVQMILRESGFIADSAILRDVALPAVETTLKTTQARQIGSDISIPSNAGNSTTSLPADVSQPVTIPSLDSALPGSGLAQGSAVTDFLLLDADDPFAKLVVTSDTALLASELASELPHTQLQRGEQLLALATNGVWFRVQLSDGLQGYVHHSEVSVEALSLLHTHRAG